MANKFPGGFPGGGMDLKNLMKQAEKMQNDMQKIKERLAEKKFEASSGGGAVRVTVNGARKIIAISISPDVIDPDDIEMLQDLILSAINEALNQAQACEESELSSLTGGLF